MDGITRLKYGIYFQNVVMLETKRVLLVMIIYLK